MSDEGTTGDQEADEPAIPRRYAQAKEDGKDLRVRPPKARKTRIKDPRRVNKGHARINAQEKRRRAMEARKAGMSYTQIAELLGYADASGASKAVHKAFSQIIQEPVAELKVLQIERINHLLMAVWSKAQAGDERAIASVLSLMDKLDRYEGTEAMTTTEVHHTGNVLVAQGSKDDFISAMKQMAGVDQNGQNMAQQVPGGAVSAPQQIVGPQYPPGMDRRTLGPQQPVDVPGEDEGDVVEAELVEELRDTLPTDDVPKAKTYKFGVDPKVKTKGTE
jgi:hypothetical protein